MAVSNGGKEIDLPFERVKQRDSCNLKVDMEIQSARGIFTNIDQLYNTSCQIDKLALSNNSVLWLHWCKIRAVLNVDSSTRK